VNKPINISQRKNKREKYNKKVYLIAANANTYENILSYIYKHTEVTQQTVSKTAKTVENRI